MHNKKKELLEKLSEEFGSDFDLSPLYDITIKYHKPYYTHYTHDGNTMCSSASKISMTMQEEAKIKTKHLQALAIERTRLQLGSGDQ